MKKICILAGSMFFVFTAYGQQSTSANTGESKLLKKQVKVDVPIKKVKNKANAGIVRKYEIDKNAQTRKVINQPVSNNSSVNGKRNENIYLKETPKK